VGIKTKLDVEESVGKNCPNFGGSSILVGKEVEDRAEASREVKMGFGRK
jgi:hypothetical protein